MRNADGTVTARLAAERTREAVMKKWASIVVTSRMARCFPQRLQTAWTRRFGCSAGPVRRQPPFESHRSDSAEAWFQMGQAYFGAGKCQNSLNAHEEAIHQQPSKAPYWVGKGNCLLCLGRTDDALHAYEKALELNNTQDYAWYGAARCYALKVEKETRLNILRSVELNARYKNRAYRDRSFRNLGNEREFQILIEP
jgi:tetratricopeptide (TPR) repeat protein